MTTRCPCPAPPGGAVTCEGRQFAYCHVEAGRVESGCIAIPPTQRGRPTPETITPLFAEVVGAIGLQNLLGREVSMFTRGPERESGGERIHYPADNVPEFLYRCMQEGWVVVVATQLPSFTPRGARFVEVLIRFPSIWSSAERGSAMLEAPLLEL